MTNGLGVVIGHFTRFRLRTLTYSHPGKSISKLGYYHWVQQFYTQQLIDCAYKVLYLFLLGKVPFDLVCFVHIVASVLHRQSKEVDGKIV